MISDVLSEAVSDIEDYLNDVIYNPVYCGELRNDIVKLKNDMDFMRQRLDDITEVSVVA